MAVDAILETIAFSLNIIKKKTKELEKIQKHIGIKYKTN